MLRQFIKTDIDGKILVILSFVLAGICFYAGSYLAINVVAAEDIGEMIAQTIVGGAFFVIGAVAAAIAISVIRDPF